MTEYILDDMTFKIIFKIICGIHGEPPHDSTKIVIEDDGNYMSVLDSNGKKIYGATIRPAYDVIKHLIDNDEMALATSGFDHCQIAYNLVEQE